MPFYAALYRLDHGMRHILTRDERSAAYMAEAYGVEAWRATEPGDLKPALAAAAEYGGPTLVDGVTPPLHEAQAPVSVWVA